MAPTLANAALVAAHSFDEGVGSTLSDSSGYANHGAISGATWTSSGKYGSALSFDGVDDIVSVPHASSLTLTTGMTLEAWVYPTAALSGWRTVMLKNGGTLAYMLNASDELPNPSTQINVGTSSWPRALAPSGLPLNEWSHLAGTYDGSTLKLYVNGTLVSSTATSGAIETTNGGPLHIGANTFWGHHFQGRIDELRIYNHALSAAEIATDMNTPVSGVPDSVAPTVPANFTATVISGTQVDLSWNASTDNIGVTGYLLERCSGSSCSNFTQIAAPTSTNFSDSGLLAGTTYRYRVRAKDAVPNYSAYSTIITGVPTVSGLVAAHSFDEGVGSTLTDSSGYANHGAISGATWTSSGKYGSALSFDGADDIVSVPHASSLTLTTGMTLEAWVYPTAPLSGWRTVMFKNGGTLAYMLNASDELPNPSTQINVGTSSWPRALAPSGLPLNTWSHLAGTYDGSTLKLYVNGALVSSTATSGSIETTNGGPLHIGANTFWGHHFQGRIDELRIYNYARTAAQITSDMNTPVATVTDSQAPTTPTSLGATAISSTQINLSWSASTDNVGVTGYLLERCEGSTCTNFAQIATPTGLSFGDSGLSAATTYRYRVRARDAASNYSGYSTVANAMTQQPSSDTQAPTAPTGLTATGVSSSQVNLSWTSSTDNVALTGYLLERCQGSSCTNFIQIATPTTNSFGDSGLTVGTTYRYRVRAQDAAPNFSAYSSIASATTTATTDTSPPTTPTNLSVTAGPNQIALSWGASTDNVGVTAYLIERCAGASCTYSQIASVATTSYTDTNVAIGTDYSYRVRARDAVPNYSSYSTAGSAMPADCD